MKERNFGGFSVVKGLMQLEDLPGFLGQSPGEAHIDQIIGKGRITVSGIIGGAVFLVQEALRSVTFQSHRNIYI